MKHIVIDEMGNRYGRLLVIGRADNLGRDAAWLCICDCGNDVAVTGGNLRAETVRSCGCLHKEILHERLSLPDGVAAFRWLIRDLKYSAKSRGLEYTLTDDQIRYFTSQSCYYCNAKPSLSVPEGREVNGNYIHNGLDRMNSNMGYTPGNVVPCCKTCNIAKNTMSMEEFVAWIDRVHYNVPRDDIFVGDWPTPNLTPPTAWTWADDAGVDAAFGRLDETSPSHINKVLEVLGV
jgi:hypothetical protein